MLTNVTANPTAEWTAQQIVETFPWDDGPRYLLRDRDSIYGEHFQRRVQNMGTEQVVIAPRSPWQNPYAEHDLKRVLSCYLAYYHRWRAHQSLEMDPPESRSVQHVGEGKVTEVAEVGGLHHHYERIAA